MYKRFFAALGCAAVLAVTAGAEAWDKTPGLYAVIDTTMGKIVCQLFEKETPKTVENFTGLADGTKEFIDLKTGQKAKRKFYDGIIFHRVIPGFMIQTGDPLGVGRGGPGYRFEDEFVPSLRFDKPGKLAMANAGPNTNGSQFFITDAATPWLDGRHTIFGQVVEGMDVVVKIARVERGMNDKPVKDVAMKNVIIKRVGDAPGVKKENTALQLSGKKVLFVVAPKDFRDEEYFEPKEMLSAAGAEVVTASLTLGELTGMMGRTTKSDVLLDKVNSADYAAVAFIGGGGAEVYFNNATAHRIATGMAGMGKPVAAICIAPSTLAHAGLLKGKKATAFASEKDELIKAGATYTSNLVEKDGQIITAIGPEAAKEFGSAIIAALQGK